MSIAALPPLIDAVRPEAVVVPDVQPSHQSADADGRACETALADAQREAAALERTLSEASGRISRLERTLAHEIRDHQPAIELEPPAGVLSRNGIDPIYLAPAPGELPEPCRIPSRPEETRVIEVSYAYITNLGTLLDVLA